MNKATDDLKNVQKSIEAYKKANPATARAIAYYRKISATRTAIKTGGSGYKTTTSTQLSSVFTTR